MASSLSRTADEELVSFALGADFSELPATVVEENSRALLDFYSCSRAGRRILDRSVDVREVLNGLFPSSRAGSTWSDLATAFFTGVVGHACDFDDTFDVAGIHPTLLAAPAVVVAANHRNLAGSEVITSLAVAREVAVRLGVSVLQDDASKPDWMQNSVFGPITTALCLARLLEFDGKTALNAVGIACQLASGTQAMGYSAGGNVRAFYGGWSALHGVLAVRMAESGVTTGGAPITGPHGLMDVFYSGRWKEDELLSDLGRDYMTVDVSLKPWPSCRVAHPFLTELEPLVTSGVVTPDSVRSIHFTTNHIGMSLSTPLETRRHPKDFMDAKFSLPYVLACMIVHGDVKLEHFNPEALKDPVVASVADRITPSLLEESEISSPFAMGGRMNVSMDEASFELDCTIIKGSRMSPLSSEDLRSKLAACEDYLGVDEAERSVPEPFLELADREEVSGFLRGSFSPPQPV